MAMQQHVAKLIKSVMRVTEEGRERREYGETGWLELRRESMLTWPTEGTEVSIIGWR